MVKCSRVNGVTFRKLVFICLCNSLSVTLEKKIKFKKKKMTYQNPFSLISLDRRYLVSKIETEMYNKSASIANDIYNNDSLNTSSCREIQKATFLLLVAENENLLENEKEYCKKK